MWSGDSTTKERFRDRRIRKSSIKREPVLRSLTYLKSEKEKERLKTIIGKYPEYRTREARLASYHGWPRQIVRQDPEDLARCGFFYIGSADRVRCFCCGTTLRNWVSGDDPYIEHLTWAPECLYVISLRRPLFPAISCEWKKSHQVNSFTEDQERLDAGDACTHWRGDRMYPDHQSADQDDRSSRPSCVDHSRTCMYDRGDGPRIHGCHRESYDHDDEQLNIVGRASTLDQAASPTDHESQTNLDDGEDGHLDQSYSTVDSLDGDGHRSVGNLIVSPQLGRDQQIDDASTMTHNSKESQQTEEGQTAAGNVKGVVQSSLDGNPLTGRNGRESRAKQAGLTATKRRGSGVLGREDQATTDSASLHSSANSGAFGPSEGDYDDLGLSVGRVPPAMMASPQVLAVLDMGLSRELVETVLQLQLRLLRSGRAYTSAVDLFLDVERFDRLC